MRKALLITLPLSLLSNAISATVCLADNPIIQTNFTADPAPMVYNDTVYLYTSHDEDDATNFTMYNWMLYSSTDMVNWTDRGIIGGVKDPNKTFKWADGYNAWAPQVIPRNGKFYLYGPFPKGGHMVIGVAVADKPTGPFVDAIGAPLINNPNSTYDIDPTVFIDDDGQAYLYWGHQPPVFYVKLNQDMISYSGSIVQLTKPQTYEEGPWFYKRNSQYYLAFASTCCPEGIGYAMSSSPTGPWTYKGSIMDGNAASSGNHPGIIDFKGTSYVFGFNYVLNFAETTVHRERRSICVEKLAYSTDGTIPKLPFWSTSGPDQIGTLNPYVQTEAETIAWSKGLKTEVCSEGGMDVTSIGSGDFIKVKGVDFGSSATSFDARVASAGGGGNIEIRLDSQTGKLVGTCAISGTGGAQTWTTKSCAISGANGVHDLYFVFTGGSGSLFNFNWWKFYGVDTPVDGGLGTGGRQGDGGPAAGGAGGSGVGAGGAQNGSGGSGAGGSRAGAGGAQTGSGGSGAGAGTGGAQTGAGGAQNGGSGAGGVGAGMGGATTGGGGASTSGGAAAGGASRGSGGAAGTGGGTGGSTAKNGSSSGCSCGMGRSSASPNALVELLVCIAVSLWSRRNPRKSR
jgi:arabinoxylan arabinofuranohydrolase